jgi:hypothetical protein
MAWQGVARQASTKKGADMNKNARKMVCRCFQRLGVDDLEFRHDGMVYRKGSDIPFLTRKMARGISAKMTDHFWREHQQEATT